VRKWGEVGRKDLVDVVLGKRDEGNQTNKQQKFDR
jgi:hypothetical protein